ncbi:MAG: hypothetical protein R8J85_08515 [Mariprofundales bacterium]
MVDAMFFGSGEVASDSSKHLGAIEGAEAARHFEPHLDHTNILFTLIVGERNLQIMQKLEQFTQVVDP